MGIAAIQATLAVEKIALPDAFRDCVAAD